MLKEIRIPYEDYEIPLTIVMPDDSEGPYPCVLMLHGFLSGRNRDGRLLARIGDVLQQSGIASARMDFCSCGDSTGPRLKYGMRQMRGEISCILQKLREDPCFQRDRIGILGHSLGGRAALSCCDLQPAFLISLNGALGSRKKLALQLADRSGCLKSGRTTVHTSDGREELLYPVFFQDLEQSPEPSADAFHGPLLICFGGQDPTVDPEVSRKFHARCRCHGKQLLCIDGANHTFQAKTGDGSMVKEAAEEICRWLQSIYMHE